MIIKIIFYDAFVICTLLILKCFSLKQNYMYVGEALYFTTIESALQECTDNYLGLQDIETSIFIKSGTYKPKNTLRCSVFGETSTINFIGEGIDKTIIECHNLNRLIAIQMGSDYLNHIWKFKDLTIKGCLKTIESVKVN